MPKVTHAIETGIDFIPNIKEFPLQFIDIIFTKFKFEEFENKIDENDNKKTVDKRSDPDENAQEVSNFFNNQDIMNVAAKRDNKEKLDKLFKRALSRNTPKISRNLFIRRSIMSTTPALEPIAEVNRVQLRNNLRSLVRNNDSSVENISVQNHTPIRHREESKENQESSFSQ